jgi:hypothetical protein
MITIPLGFQLWRQPFAVGLVVAFQRQRAAALASANGKANGGDSYHFQLGIAP